jgi:hypothetical protein
LNNHDTKEGSSMKKFAIIVGTILAFLSILGLNCYAEMVYGCKQKNDGQLRIVNDSAACRPSETPISWNITGSENAHTNGQVPSGPSVFDASGQYLGIMPGTMDGYLSVLIPTLSKFIFISPETGDLNPYYPAVYLYFDKTDCSGNAYLDFSMGYEVFKLGSKYIVAEDVAAKPVDILSISGPDWGSGKRPCTNVNYSYLVLPYKEITLPFNMPVILPLQIRY